MSPAAALRRAPRALARLLPASIFVDRARTAGRRIALTFDDGPDPLTSRYLDALDGVGARCTFFLCGDACVRRPEDVLAIVRRGHEVAGHGYTHTRFTELSSVALADELARTSALLLPTAAGRPLVRPPYGTLSARVLVRLARAGYTVALWSVDSLDFSLRDPGELAARLTPDRVRPGDIVLLHEGQSWTLAALPAIVGGLVDAGYQLVTVSELCGR
jgi:peptidoglycan/xylan/chitin deacetylase (PgdA/CDA1 family)